MDIYYEDIFLCLTDYRTNRSHWLSVRSGLNVYGQVINLKQDQNSSSGFCLLIQM